MPIIVFAWLKQCIATNASSESAGLNLKAVCASAEILGSFKAHWKARACSLESPASKIAATILFFAAFFALVGSFRTPPLFVVLKAVDDPFQKLAELVEAVAVLLEEVTWEAVVDSELVAVAVEAAVEDVAAVEDAVEAAAAAAAAAAAVDSELAGAAAVLGAVGVAVIRRRLRGRPTLLCRGMLL
jgi:hypothetical protein